MKLLLVGVLVFLGSNFLAAQPAAPKASPANEKALFNGANIQLVPPSTVRARGLGIPFEGTPGSLNAITDVAGVAVGHVTLISGEGKLDVGKGPIRTGVTAILPRGRESLDQPCMAGAVTLNGNGEMTGTHWVNDSGFLEGPVMMTNTHCVGTVRDAVIKWRVKAGPPDPSGFWWSLPVVAETWDAYLNDINGFHVKAEDAFAALDGAKTGPVAEGGVGAGTGCIGYEFKAGIGTSSRKLGQEAGGYTVGVLVQENCGRRHQLLIAGIPVGVEITEGNLSFAATGTDYRDEGSIIITVATDAPLLSHQLQRVARRAGLGVARTGHTSGDGSGDLFIAFSTANPKAWVQTGHTEVTMLANAELDAIFEATVQATEEAVVNALIAGRTMTGIDGHKVIGLPHDRLVEILKAHHRLVEAH